MLSNMEQTLGTSTQANIGVTSGISGDYVEIPRVVKLNRVDFKMPVQEKTPEYANIPLKPDHLEALVRVLLKDVKPEQVYDYVMSKVPDYNLNSDETEKVLAKLGYAKEASGSKKIH